MTKSTLDELGIPLLINEEKIINTGLFEIIYILNTYYFLCRGRKSSNSWIRLY